ncbi:MAG TPA: pyrroline-5-carboxylate reductase, partial [Anaerolineales bacterium]|nr:pyrroline-5-carboxylate reductase [Anaerolineales bacterium]
GPGAMAGAMISGLIRENVAPADSILASGPNVERVEELQQRYGIHPYKDNVQAVAQADVVVFSIKPQTLEKVLAELKGKIRPDALVLSIIAGAPIRKISKGLHHDHIVRSMPNTPARIGMGITVWTASASVSEEQKEMARLILGALGSEVFMEEEKYLDMATALSGTGPAYVFLFMEAMVDAGVHLGFPRRVAEQLVIETLRGSVEYFTERQKDRPLHVAGMRNEVTSPGGTTAAAMYFLEKAGFRTAISRAIWAAYERSLELGKDPRAHAPESG